MSKITIIEDFSEAPGGRLHPDGPDSGEYFRKTALEPFFQSGPPKEPIVIDFDGIEGYAASFLEEAFGGLVRLYGFKMCKKWLHFKSDEDAGLVPRIERYMQRADA